MPRLVRAAARQRGTCAHYNDFVRKKIGETAPVMIFMYSLCQKQCTTALTEKSRFFLRSIFLKICLQVPILSYYPTLYI